MKRFFATIIFITSTLACIAQNVLTVEAPDVVTSDETFRIVFTANGKMSDFNWDGTNDFDIVWGPQTGSMSSTNIVNGKRTSTHQETVTYLLQPKGEGKFTLGSATAKVAKETCSTKPFTIEVVKARQESSSQPSQQGSTASQVQSTGTVSNNDIFLKLSVSKTNVVKGEPITATLKLYTRTDISGFEDIHFPTFNGFWSKETVTVNNLEFKRENVNGSIYNSALVRKYMLIPQQSGTLTIDPAEMVCQIRVRTGSNMPRSIFDDFFDSYQTIRKRISTPEVTVRVKEIPAGAPASFKGGVGNFKITSSLSRNDIKSNEAVSLIVTVSGSGNVSMLEAPDINFPPDFEVYDLKSSDKVASDGASGSKTFEFPFIPRSHGEFTIDPVEYSFYDVTKGKYTTIKTDPIHVTIEKGEEIAGGGVAVAGINRQGVRNLTDDIRYIHIKDTGLTKSGTFLAGSVLFYALAAVIIALFFVAVRIFRFTEARKADVVGAKNRRANKMARNRLRNANTYLQKGLSTAYYEELHKALIGYVSDKLTIPSANLSKDSISEGLAARGAKDATINDFLALVDKCEFARYSPDNEKVKMENEYNEAIKVISQLESEVKKTGRTGKAGAVTAIVALIILSSNLNAYAQDDVIDDSAVVEVAEAEMEAEAAPQGIEGLWDRACSAYEAGQWENALNMYRMIEGEQLQSADLFYNMGNALFKSGDNTHAILYYEKALKLDPGHEDAANNLSIANQFTLDKIEAVPDFILTTWMKRVGNSLTADNWAKASLVLLLVTAILMVIFRVAQSSGIRKLSFIAAILFFLLCIGAFGFSISQKNRITAQESAIVTSPVSSVKSSPTEGGNAIFVLHEGTKVRIMDEVGTWRKIEIADGRQGWLSSETIEII